MWYLVYVLYRYVALDKEMEEISCVWKSAKDHLHHHQQVSQWTLYVGRDCTVRPTPQESRRQSEIKADGNTFMKMKDTSPAAKTK